MLLAANGHVHVRGINRMTQRNGDYTAVSCVRGFIQIKAKLLARPFDVGCGTLSTEGSLALNEYFSVRERAQNIRVMAHLSGHTLVAQPTAYMKLEDCVTRKA